MPAVITYILDMNIYKNIAGSILILCCSSVATARNLDIKTDTVVGINQPFQIEYSMEERQNITIEEFIPPVFPKHFVVIAGPWRSSGISSSADVTTKTLSFKYTVQATRTGMFNILPAGMKMSDSSVIKSKTQKIKVIKKVRYGKYALIVPLSVKTEAEVIIGQSFNADYRMQIEYRQADNSPVGDFIPPVFSSDFKVIAGPMQRLSTSTIDGVCTVSLMVSYTLQAKREGGFNIPQAGVKMKDGSVQKSKPTPVKVVKKAATDNLFVTWNMPPHLE